MCPIRETHPRFNKKNPNKAAPLVETKSSSDGESSSHHNKFFDKVFDGAEDKLGDPLTVTLHRLKTKYRFEGDPQGIREKIAEFNVSSAPLHPVGEVTELIPSCVPKCTGFIKNNDYSELWFAREDGVCAKAYPYVYVPDSNTTEVSSASPVSVSVV